MHYFSVLYHYAGPLLVSPLIEIEVFSGVSPSICNDVFLLPALFILPSIISVLFY